jgi:hypothetical protein
MADSSLGLAECTASAWPSQWKSPARQLDEHFGTGFMLSLLPEGTQARAGAKYKLRQRTGYPGMIGAPCSGPSMTIAVATTTSPMSSVPSSMAIRQLDSLCSIDGEPPTRIGGW